MQFNITSDYAIRTVLYLAQNRKRNCSAKEIEEVMCVPAGYLSKLTKSLRLSGIIETIQGANGGYRLAKKPENITLYDILSLTEKSLNINGCIDDAQCCSRDAAATCPVRCAFCEISNELNIKLKSITIKYLLDKK